MSLHKRITASQHRPFVVERLEPRQLLVASLDVQATLNTVDSDSPPGIIVNDGATVATSYKVTNTGDVVLSNVTVVDDNGTPLPNDDFVPAQKLTVQSPLGSLLATHSIGFAHDFVMHPTKPLIYVSIEGVTFGQDKVLVINTNTLTLVAAIDVGSTEPTHLALSKDGSRLYLGTQGGGFWVGVIDTNTNTSLPNISVGGWAYKGLEVGADGQLLVHQIGAITQNSPVNGQKVGPDITLPGADWYYGYSQVSPDKTRLYYASDSPVWSTFNQIDLTTDPPTRLWRHQSNSVGLDIAITHDSAYVSFLAEPGIDGVTGVPKYRTSDMSLVGAFNTGGIAREMVYSPDGQIAYIVSATGKIGIWDANTFQKLGDIPVTGGEPVEMQVDASGKYLFVSVDGPTDSLQIYSTGRNGVHNVGDLNGNQKLDPSETWTYEATITARSGPNVHIATATAQTANGQTVTDTDPSHYLVYPTWEAEGSVLENISGAVIGPIPAHPWTGGWVPSDFRFEVVQGNLRLKVGQALTTADDDGLVVELYTAEATPKRLGYYSVAVQENELPWHRTGESRDVDGNGDIVALDALMIINRLNLVGPGPLGARPAGEIGLLDVDGDGEVQAIDALIVINYLNGITSLVGGESAAPETPEVEETAAVDEAHASADLLVALLSDDPSETQKTKRRAAGPL